MRIEKDLNEKILHEHPIAAKRPESTLHVTLKGGIVERVDKSYSLWLNVVYDKYAGLLFPVLTDLCLSSDDAEIALVETFAALPTHENLQPGKPINLMRLVKLAIDTARRHVTIKDPVCVHCFRQSTLLHYFICEDGTMEALCQKSGLTSADIARQLHLEIQMMRTKK